MSNYDTMTKKDLLAAVAEQDAEAATGLARKTKAVIIAWLVANEEQPVRSMAATLSRYRGGYQETVSYTNRLSLNNGDEIAKLLAGMTPDQVMAVAERVLGLAPGELATKYASLNPGQKRMNSGNRIRAAAKRGDIVADDVRKALKKAA